MGSEAERSYLPARSFSPRLTNISLCNKAKGRMKENVGSLVAVGHCHDYQLLSILGETVKINRLGNRIVAVGDLQGHTQKNED